MSKYPPIISINNEIVKTIKDKKKILDENYRKISDKLDKFTEDFEHEPIESMKKAEDIVNWLKECSITIKLLDNYVNNFPNVRHPLNNYFTDNIQKINDVNINNITQEAFYSVLPLVLIYQQILYIREI